ncbi:MAG: hypothetical protein ACI4L8_08555, partial [Candidatus Fimadaptatus sp.]
MGYGNFVRHAPTASHQPRQSAGLPLGRKSRALIDMRAGLVDSSITDKARPQFPSARAKRGAPVVRKSRALVDMRAGLVDSSITD